MKNLLLCAVGVVVGFTVGFFVTNAVTKPQPAGAQARAAAAPGGEARPLKPEQMGGELPPGHPTVENGGAGAPASTSAEAQAAMDKADRAPKEFAAQADAARVFYELRDYAKAALYAERALALNAKDFDTLVLAGNAKYDAQDYAAAADLYERALRVKADSPDVRTDYGNTFFNRGEYDRAVAEYRKSIAIDPDHVNSWRNLAAAAVQKGDRRLGEEAVAQLSRLAPQSQETEAYRQRLSQMQ